MATQRIITGHQTDPVEDTLNLSLRPQSLDEYVGQPKLIQKLRITLQAVKQRAEPMEHVLLHGPPGLGKTTLGHIIANEMGTHMVLTSGPALTRPTDLVGLLTKLQTGDILFIDEIHRLNPVIEEYLYPAMENFKIDVTVDSGMHAKTITLPLKPFCLIGATTRAGLLSGPMRSRFGITHNLEFYSHTDLLQILCRSASLMNIPEHDPDDLPADAQHDQPSSTYPRNDHASLSTIAARSRGTPRIANRLLRRVRDFSQVKADSCISADTVDESLRLEGVDERGMDEIDRKYMQVIAKVYAGGPVGLEAVAATLGEDAGTLEDMVEPYLLQVGFLARTRKGRQLTQAAADHLGLQLNTVNDEQATGLFNG